MAKALYGHLPAQADLGYEVTRLRARVSELQDEVTRLRRELAARDDLAAQGLLLGSTTVLGEDPVRVAGTVRAAALA